MNRSQQPPGAWAGRCMSPLPSLTTWNIQGPPLCPGQNVQCKRGHLENHGAVVPCEYEFLAWERDSAPGFLGPAPLT